MEIFIAGIICICLEIKRSVIQMKKILKKHEYCEFVLTNDSEKIKKRSRQKINKITVFNLS